MSECLFCKIVAGEIPCTKVFENESVLAFEDIHPSAKTHWLFIHKNHSKNALEMLASEIAEVYLAIQTHVNDGPLSQSGIRVVTNCGPDSGQVVFHTHFHVIGGEQLGGFGRRSR